MYANIVFAGGGVKGAALGGCLAAAEANDVTPVGFGGTSAGSIVAILASVGYTGEDLEKLLVATDLLTFLDDNGNFLKKVSRDLAALNEKMSQNFWQSRCYTATVLCAYRAMRHLSCATGIYDGEPLKDFLVTQIARKLECDEKEVRGATFRQLRKMGGKPLRVVATDLNTRRAVLLGDETSDIPAVLAVRASAGYPMLFSPVNYQGMRLVDGGLSSNLPAFLFEREYIEDRITTLAFDLILPEVNADLDKLAVKASGAPEEKKAPWKATHWSAAASRKTLPRGQQFPVRAQRLGFCRLSFASVRDDWRDLARRVQALTLKE